MESKAFDVWGCPLLGGDLARISAVGNLDTLMDKSANSCGPPSTAKAMAPPASAAQSPAPAAQPPVMTSVSQVLPAQPSSKFTWPNFQKNFLPGGFVSGIRGAPQMGGIERIAADKQASGACCAAKPHKVVKTETSRHRVCHKTGKLIKEAASKHKARAKGRGSHNRGPAARGETRQATWPDLAAKYKPTVTGLTGRGSQAQLPASLQGWPVDLAIADNPAFLRDILIGPGTQSAATAAAGKASKAPKGQNASLEPLPRNRALVPTTPLSKSQALVPAARGGALTVAPTTVTSQVVPKPPPLPAKSPPPLPVPGGGPPPVTPPVVPPWIRQGLPERVSRALGLVGAGAGVAGGYPLTKAIHRALAPAAASTAAAAPVATPTATAGKESKGKGTSGKSGDTKKKPLVEAVSDAASQASQWATKAGPTGLSPLAWGGIGAGGLGTILLLRALVQGQRKRNQRKLTRPRRSETVDDGEFKTAADTPAPASVMRVPLAFDRGPQDPNKPWWDASASGPVQSSTMRVPPALNRGPQSADQPWWVPPDKKAPAKPTRSTLGALRRALGAGISKTFGAPQVADVPVAQPSSPSMLQDWWARAKTPGRFGISPLGWGGIGLGGVGTLLLLRMLLKRRSARKYAKQRALQRTMMSQFGYDVPDEFKLAHDGWAGFSSYQQKQAGFGGRLGAAKKNIFEHPYRNIVGATAAVAAPALAYRAYNTLGAAKKTMGTANDSLTKLDDISGQVSQLLKDKPTELVGEFGKGLGGGAAESVAKAMGIEPDAPAPAATTASAPTATPSTAPAGAAPASGGSGYEMDVGALAPLAEALGSGLSRGAFGTAAPAAGALTDTAKQVPLSLWQWARTPKALGLSPLAWAGLGAIPIATLLALRSMLRRRRRSAELDEE